MPVSHDARQTAEHSDGHQEAVVSKTSCHRNESQEQAFTYGHIYHCFVHVTTTLEAQ